MWEQVVAKINEWGKKYQVDLAYIIRSEFWVYLRYGVLLITGLAVSVTFARLASQEVYGQYNFLLAILGVASLLSIPGLGAAVLRSVARGYDGNYKQAVKTRFLWSLLGIPALLGAGAYYYYYGTQIIGICLMMASVFFPFFYAPSIWGSLLGGKRRFDLIAKFGAIQATVTAAAMVTILFLNANHLVLIIATYLVSTSFLNCLLFKISLKYAEESSAKDDECTRYGYFLTGISIAGTAATHIDKILIGILLSSPELAIYVIALAIPTRLKDLSKIFWAPFAPKFSQNGIEIEHVSEKLKRLALPLTLLVLAGSALYLLFVDDIIILLFSEKYIGSIIYAKILLLMILLTMPSTFLMTFAIAKKNTKVIVRVDIICAFLKLFIMSGFIYLWGIMGAAWGLVLWRAIQILIILASMRGGGGDWKGDKTEINKFILEKKGTV